MSITVVEKTNAPIWRTGAFAGEFGDSYIKDTNLEGGSVVEALTHLIPIMDNILNNPENFLDDLCLFNQERDSLKLREILKSLTFAAAVYQFIHNASANADAGAFIQLLKVVTKTIKDLNNGERVVLPGGWATPSGGHAIMYVVECVSNDNYAFCVCNTGNGINYHPSNAASYPKTKYITAMRFGDIPLSRIASIEFWYMMFNLMILRSTNHGPKVVYDVLLPFLADGPVHPLVEKEIHKCGHWESPQLSGTCFYRCILSTIRYLMKSDGFSKLQQKQLFLKIRSGYLDVAEEQLRNSDNVRHLNESDLYMIELACSQTGNAAAKIFSGDSSALNVATMHKLDSQFKRISGVTSIIRSSLFLNTNLHLDKIESVASFNAFNGFDLIIDESDRSVKRGSTAAGSNSLYVNLMIPFEHPTSLYELCNLFEWTAERCDEIRTKSNLAAASVGLNQVCSFLEYLFLNFIEFPAPISSAPTSDSADESKEVSGLWTNFEHMTSETQRSGLTNLFRLTAHYVSASYSLGSADRAASSVKKITTATIFVVFDALIRVVLPMNPLPVAEVLQGYGCTIMCMLNGNQSIDKIADRYILSRPECCKARFHVLRYLKSVSTFASKSIFDYKYESGRDFSMALDESSSTFEFIKDLRIATDSLSSEIPTASSRRGRTIQSRVAQLNEIESLYAWFVSSWNEISPEFARYRDINLLFRLMLQYESMFGTSPPQVEVWLTHDAQPEYDFLSTGNDRKVVMFTALLAGVSIRPPCKACIESPLVELLSGITNSTEELDEEAMLFNDRLPDFNHTLSDQEAEQFFTLLVHPYIASPLVLHFFSGDRIALLVNPEIQSIVEALVFEPRTISYVSDTDAAEDIHVVPAITRSKLRTRFGIAYDEMKLSPRVLLIPLVSLVENAVAISISGFKSSVVDLVLFLVRICLRLEMIFIDSYKTEQQLQLSTIPDELFQLQSLLASRVSKKIEEWVTSALRDREIELAVKFYSHLSLIYAASLDLAELDQGNEWFLNDQIYPFIKKYLCACTYVTCWHENKKTEASGTAVRRSRVKSPQAASPNPTETIPVSSVFYSVQRLRPAIHAWMQAAPAPQMNETLDAIASIGLQHPFQEASGWSKVSNAPLVCSLTLGTDVHPYMPCTDWSQTVSFPGATSISIFFDPRSATEKTNDYVTISYPGCILKFDGPAGSHWPGSNGSPALSIPYDTFVVEFHSDRSGGDWGFQLTAVAPICLPAAQTLVDQTNCSMLVAQLALRESRNYEEIAFNLITKETDRLLALEAAELKKRNSLDSSGEVSPGLYQDCYGYVQINLQSCEVYINNRMNMPIPSEIASHADFMIHFGKYKNLLCTVSSKDTNRHSIQIIDPDGMFGAYEVQAWTPMKPYGRKGSGLGAILNDDLDASADDGRCTAFNMPIPSKDCIFYLGQNYVRYPRGKCGWVSQIFEKLGYLTDDDLIGIWCSENCMKMSESLKIEPTDEDIVGKLYVQMQCAPGGRDLSDIEGHPGAFFEVVAIQSERLILVFALVDVGRKMQRTLVYSSNINISLATLQPNTEALKEPKHYLLQADGGYILDTFKDRSGRIVPRPGVGSHQQATVYSLVIRRSRLEISKLVENVSDADLGIFCPRQNIVSVSQEEEVLEEFINSTCLRGIVPEYFLEEYQFWRTGSRLIRGYKYPATPSPTQAFHSDSILVVIDKDGSNAVIHKLRNGKREMTLMNPLVQSNNPKNATMRALLTVFTRIEVLSHILFWSTSAMSGSSNTCEISKIELPRLKTAFDVKIHNNSVEYALSDHDDLTLCFEVPAFVRQLYEGFANCIPVKNSTNQYFLLVPSFGLILPSVKSCPFSTSIVYDRSSEWSGKVQSRYFLYPVHPSSKFLEMPTISAALYWTLLCFIYRKYSLVANLVSSVCQSDLKLNAEHRYILSQIPKTASDSMKNVDSHPDAHACRLMLALMCLDCGERINSNEWKSAFWDVSEDLTAYYSKYAHVSQVCRLNFDEEKAILSLFPDSKRNLYLDALEVASDNEPATFTLTSNPPQSTYDPLVTSAKSLKSTLENWKTSLAGNASESRLFFRSRGNGVLFYRRPTATELKGAAALSTLGSMWKCFEFQHTLSGSLSFLGFSFLYELLSGQLQLHFDAAQESAVQTELAAGIDDSLPPPGPPPGAAVGPPPASAQPEFEFVEKYKKKAKQIMEMGICSDWSIEEVTCLIDIHDGEVEPAMINAMEDPDGAKIMVFSKLNASSFTVGQNIECNYRGYGQWYSAVIAECPGNDLFNIEFNDGGFEKNVPKDLIRPLENLEDANVVKLLESTGILGEFSRLEIIAFVKMNKSRNIDEVISEYFNDPETVKSNLKKFMDEEKEAIKAQRIERETPRSFPYSWILVKLIVHMMFIVDTGSNTRELGLLLLCIKIIEKSKKSDLRGLPLFPYHANAKQLDSQQGLDIKKCGFFYNTVIDKCLSVLTGILSTRDEAIQAAVVPATITVNKSDYHVRPSVSNSKCSRRKVQLLQLENVSNITEVERSALERFNISFEELNSLVHSPLSQLQCFQKVVYINDGTSSLNSLPFDISHQPAAHNNPPADAMIQRIKDDLQQSSEKLANKLVPKLNFLQGIDFSNGNTASIIQELEVILEELLRCMTDDNDKVIEGIQLVEDLLNVIEKENDSVDKVIFRFLLRSGKRSRVRFEMFAASLSSDCQYEDLTKINPFISRELCDALSSATIILLMRFVRSRQIASCIDKVRKFIGVLQTKEGNLTSFNHMLTHQAVELTQEIVKVRHCTFNEADGTAVDPRYLLFEFITGFLLRKRQVELIEDFMNSHKSGKSSVHQMIMGAGKTQIIAPILALMLANGEQMVTIVCPGPLLPQSRSQLRSRFSNVLPKRILTLAFERSSPESNDLDALHRLRIKLEVAKEHGSIVLTTPQSVKSLFLKYIDLLQQVRNAPAIFRLPQDQIDSVILKKMKPQQGHFSNCLEMADVLRQILKIWSTGIALLDEVDLLLHPLKSELNFPIGMTEDLPLLPQRFELPLHLMDPFLSRKSKKLGKVDSKIWDDIQAVIEEGKNSFCFQSIPHLVLLNEDYFMRKLRYPVSQWAVRWICVQQNIFDDCQQIIHTPHYTITSEDITAYIVQYLYCESTHANAVIASEFIHHHFSESSIQVLNLARQWIWVYLPHVLSKIHRVSFGLIGDDDIQRWKDQEVEAAGGDPSAAQNVVISKSRRLLAVPFVGKDVPSRSSEFANPEVQIGLTIIAYKLHGLRQKNTKELVTELKRNFLMEPGPFGDRPSRILFEEWKTEASLETDKALEYGDILPLEILQTADDSQMKIVTDVLKLEPSVVTYYLIRFVFPNVLKYKSTKLQANGIDLGGEMIFGNRYGFSGTPSDLLPLEIRPCHYEPGSEAEIIRTLSNPSIMAAPEILQIGHNWNVDMLLERVAQGNYNALIDSGALITGYTTEQVARKLLEFQHPQKVGKKEVCVFLDERDMKMVVDISGGPAYELDRCGVILDKRMVFYDHVHTTGIDIKHAIDAVAVCTLGKDLTLRDYSQGCWRMRGLGLGQRIHVLIIEEINKLIESTQCTNNKLADILAWLTVNSITSEKMQFLQLENQIAANSKRQEAFKCLSAINKISLPPKGKTFLPSPFFCLPTSEDIINIKANSTVSKLLTDKKPTDTEKNYHAGMWRSRKISSMERVFCQTRFNESNEEPTKCDCAHYADTYQIIAGAHWTCCGDRNKNSKHCKAYDPREIVDFSSMMLLIEPLIHEFFMENLRILARCDGPEDFSKAEFMESLAKLAPLETTNPDVWKLLNGNLYPPCTDMNISTLLVESKMLEYADSLFNTDAIKVIKKFTLPSSLPVVVSTDSGAASYDALPVEREQLRDAIDVFMETINVSISSTVHVEIASQPNNPADDAAIEEGVSAAVAPKYLLSAANTHAMVSGPHDNDVPTIELHNNDREIVQEQEKERDEEREMEIFKVVHPEGDRNSKTDPKWPVKKLLEDKSLISQDSSFDFYPLKDFCLTQDPESRVPYPSYLYVSEAYAPLIHASSSNRRLKNVSVLLQWLPASQTQSAGKEAEEPVTIIISLAEAETLRFLIERSSRFGPVASLWSIDPQTNGTAITQPLFRQFKSVSIGRRTPLVRCDSVDASVADKQKLLDIATQFARYFNGCMYFDDNSILNLLAYLQRIPKQQRKHLFDANVRCRLRDQIQTDYTPVTHVFENESPEALERLLGLIQDIKTRLVKEFKHSDDAFNHFAGSRNLEFSPSDLVLGLTKLSPPFALTEDDAVAITTYITSTSLLQAKSIHRGPTISKNNFFKLRPSTKLADDFSASLIESLRGLNVESVSGKSNIFQGHSQRSSVAEGALKSVNEFFSHLHTPNIQSLGQIVVIPTPASSASGQSSRVNISNDNCISTDSEFVLTVAPRGVKLTKGLWCFELTVITPGLCQVGFTDPSITRNHRQQTPMLCGVAGAKTIPIDHAAQGDIIRFYMNLGKGKVEISYQMYQCKANKWDEAPVQVLSDFQYMCALFPFVSFDKTFKFRLNFGNLPFCSQLGNMPLGCHSLSHWIRKEQERQYVRNRHALGGYGNLSNVSGRYHLEIAKLDEAHQWEMKMASTENKKGSTYWEAAFPTVFVDGVLLTQGKWYYEVTIRTNNVASQFGWADLDFVASNDNGQGVGDEKHSWAYDGDRRCLWHERSIQYGEFWKVGDVLGCACDLDVGCKTIQFSLNGRWFSPIAFPGIQYSVGLMPALTTQARLSSVSYYVNLSHKWAFKPPSEAYKPICEWIEYGKEYFAPPPVVDPLSALGSPEEDEDVAVSVSAPGKMFRQLSAQPQHISNAELWYVPLIVKAGLDQVVVANPTADERTAPLTVRCCSEDENSYPSVVADRISLTSGKWCYEVKLLVAPQNAKCCFGFAEQTWSDMHWSEMSGVGDDAVSWGAFYKSGSAIYSRSGKKTIPEDALSPHFKLKKDLKEPIIVSIGIDFDTKTMVLSVDGSEPVVVIENFTATSGLIPAFSLQGSSNSTSRRSEMVEQIEFEVNFGERPFEQPVFDSLGYQTVHSSLFPK